MKTDGINFSEKFIWLDDDLWEDELKVLEEYNATDNFILVDLNKRTQISSKILLILFSFLLIF